MRSRTASHGGGCYDWHGGRPGRAPARPRTTRSALAAPKTRGGTLTVGLNTDIVSLDPNDIVFANVPMFYQVYNYLVQFTDTLQARPNSSSTGNWRPAQ